MKNILTKIFSSKKELSSKEISFLEIAKTTKVSELFNVISNYNDLSEIRYVGGCVRKILNNEKFDDIDLATNLKPEEVKECLKNNNIDYFHCTSNNTIYWTQIKNFPKVSTKLFCDMSSDIFSRTINTSNFDLIYAGAQKNIGPAGMTLVILKKSILENKNTNLGTMLDYNTHIQKESMFNTPPVFSIYVSMLNLKWLSKNGGIDWIDKINNTKANLLYNHYNIN